MIFIPLAGDDVITGGFVALASERGGGGRNIGGGSEEKKNRVFVLFG